MTTDNSVMNQLVYTYGDAAKTDGVSPNSFANTMQIGAQNNLYYLNGSIDQFRIFNKSINQAEVTQLFNEQ